MKDKNKLLRMLPKVDECLARLESYVEEYEIPLRVAKKGVQQAVEQLRNRLLNDEQVHIPKSQAEWDEIFKRQIGLLMDSNLKRVINGTGIVVHTNLGRSLLPDHTIRQLSMAGACYTNLEFNLKTGKRGSRYSLVEEVICDLTGAEAALVVNNNAAAVLISLDTLARDREVIISRGQLVEIGGSFRIPDVMKKSGAALVEVGATNRTHLYDYEQAISDSTALLLRVHTSNFRIIGFTSQVSAEELVGLGKKYELPVMEDLGSGSFTDLSTFGLPPEPTVQEVVKSGVDVVVFSGDKLLGGPQSGIIVGKEKIISRIKKNPLNRALRIDKFTLASLESVLRDYYDPEKVMKKNQTLRMISDPPEIIKKRAQRLMRRTRRKIEDRCALSMVSTISRVGGGALPEYGLASWAVELNPGGTTVSKLEKDFRALPVPVIGRIENERLLIDFRTVLDGEIPELSTQLINYFS
ncbi:MAG: L-seryl-tRNA(Sec) selenium transferase [Desulfofustis sp.]|nr:L-seryl-tRNA(Sec) selenium transferase [Desulfofustis sp.]